MEKKSLKLGYIFAAICLLGNGLQPIISNARPDIIDDLSFTWLTVVMEFVFITPLFALEQRKQQTPTGIVEEYWKRLIFIGMIFAVSTLLVIIGYSHTHSVTGAVLVKTQPLSMFLIGVVFLKEKVHAKEILATLLMLVSIIYIATEGTFHMENLTISSLWLVLAPIMWNIGHSFSKPLLDTHKITPTQLIFYRTFGSSIILTFIYFLGVGFDSLLLNTIIQWQNFQYIIYMGINYAFLHYFWYKTIIHLDLSHATAIIIPAPIITAVFSIFFFGRTNFYLSLYWISGNNLGIIWFKTKKRNSRSAFINQSK